MHEMQERRESVVTQIESNERLAGGFVGVN
jgi:hypothetical protein